MRFTVWCPGDGETDADALSIEAQDGGAAALEWDRLVSEREKIVCVRAEDGTETRWAILARAVLNYGVRQEQEGEA